MVDPPDEAPDAVSREELEERIARSLPGLQAFVRARLGPGLSERESASDIVQSTFRELLAGSDRLEDRGEESFQRWLRRAAEHKLRKRARHWRAQRRDRPTDSLERMDLSADDDARPSRDAVLHEETQRLERAFAALSHEHGYVIRRLHVEGASYAEIGGELGKSPEAVRKLVARALAKLAAYLRPISD